MRQELIRGMAIRFLDRSQKELQFMETQIVQTDIAL